MANILAYDTQPERRSEVETRFGIRTVGLLKEGWSSSPGVALIAAPTSLHVPLALEAAQRGCHLFIEKPLGDALDDTDSTLEQLATHGRWGRVQAFRCAMAVERITNTNRSTVYAFNAQRILFEPYQYKPLL